MGMWGLYVCLYIRLRGRCGILDFSLMLNFVATFVYLSFVALFYVYILEHFLYRKNLLFLVELKWKWTL